MKILLLMDPGIPVPPSHYGGHERLVYLFAEEYLKLGHEVTLLAGPQSRCSGTTITFGTNNLNRSGWERFKEACFVWKYLFRNHGKFDLIHNFGRLVYLLPVLHVNVKKIMTYGRPVSVRGIKWVTALPGRNLIFTACSNYCVSTGNVAGRWETVYNAIDFSKYQLRETVENNAPLIFLGRLDKIKGAHVAIEVARKTSNVLWLAGNIPETPDNLAYFKEHIEPKIDGKQVVYLGALNDAQKNEYLGRAKALLFPIEWDEPFGMVMIEAMACGTPVVAFNRGSVPEVVNLRTGFIVANKHEMESAIQSVHTIDRKICSLTARSAFDVTVIAKNYLKLFQP